MKLYRVDMHNEASATLYIVAPEGHEEEAGEIAYDNAPQAAAQDDYEFSDEWLIDGVEEVDPNEYEPSMNVFQAYDLDDDDEDDDNDA